MDRSGLTTRLSEVATRTAARSPVAHVKALAADTIPHDKVAAPSPTVARIKNARVPPPVLL